MAKICDGNVVTDRSACPLSLEAAILFCVQLKQAQQLVCCQQTSAYLTPYKAVAEEENDEKHSTINLDWQI